MVYTTLLLFIDNVKYGFENQFGLGLKVFQVYGVSCYDYFFPLSICICHIDAAEQQRELNFESLVSN